MNLVPSSHTTKKNKRWHVLYVKSKRETSIQDQINALDLDIIAYSPTHVVIKQWKDRRKKVNTPLLPKIVLVKTEEKLRDKVFQIAGTVRYLFELRKPAIVREIEIEQLRAITDNSRVIDHEITSIVKGTEIDLTPYGFKDLKGIVDNVSNTVCWVTLKTLSCTLKLKLKKRK
jgi:transcription antitermination factor NusG